MKEFNVDTKLTDHYLIRTLKRTVSIQQEYAGASGASRAAEGTVAAAKFLVAAAAGAAQRACFANTGASTAAEWRVAAAAAAAPRMHARTAPAGGA